MRDPGVAAVLSAIIPGIGQFYNGRFLTGILWLIITPGLWIGTGGLLGWVCHVISAYTATGTRVNIRGSLGNDRSSCRPVWQPNTQFMQELPRRSVLGS